MYYSSSAVCLAIVVKNEGKRLFHLTICLGTNVCHKKWNMTLDWYWMLFDYVWLRSNMHKPLLFWNCSEHFPMVRPGKRMKLVSVTRRWWLDMWRRTPSFTFLRLGLGAWRWLQVVAKRLVKRNHDQFVFCSTSCPFESSSCLETPSLLMVGV